MREDGTSRDTARNGTAGPDTTPPGGVPANGTGRHDDLPATTTPEGEREEQMSAAETGGDERTPTRPDTATGPIVGTARVGRWHRRIPQVLALALVWVLLWGSVTPMAVVGGLLIATLVTSLFPLPLLPERLPFRPLKVLRLVTYLAVDLVVSGVRVSIVTLVHGPRAASGIIGLPLCTSSDRTTTTVVAACALTPGSFALQIDRRRGRWYVYALGLHREGAVDRVRRDMMNLQMRVIDAIGSEDDVRRCREAVVAVAEGRDTARRPR